MKNKIALGVALAAYLLAAPVKAEEKVVAEGTMDGIDYKVATEEVVRDQRPFTITRTTVKYEDGKTVTYAIEEPTNNFRMYGQSWVEKTADGVERRTAFVKPIDSMILDGNVIQRKDAGNLEGRFKKGDSIARAVVEYSKARAAETF